MNFFGHNFGVVYRFEVLRMLKKRSFWASIVILPLIFAALFGVINYAQQNSDKAMGDLAKQKFSIVYTDDSGEIDPIFSARIGAKIVADKNVGEKLVRENKIDAYFYFPQDLSKNKVEISAKNVGIFDNNKYSSIAQSLVHDSAVAAISRNVQVAVANQVSVQLTTFQNGKKYDPLMAMIAPGIFLVLFYLIIVMFGGQMMSATVEEKENRVMEMILTTIKSRTLIIGKIFAFLTLILIQVAVIVSLLVLAYFAFRHSLNLPSVDFSNLPLDPARIVAAFAIFAGSILLFSGVLVALGAMTPTAREASQYLSIPMVFIFMPLYLAPMLLASTTNFVISVLTFFPFTSPIPLMLRNAAGNLSLGETVIGVAILFVSAGVVFLIAARLFATGAVEYSRKLSLKSLFRAKN